MLLLKEYIHKIECASIPILTVAPLIDVPPMDMNVTTTENITLTCIASGYPAPSISWSHNGTTVNESISISITEQDGDRMTMSTLIVTGAVVNDSGQYECSAISPVGNFQIVESGPVTILVQGKTFTSLLEHEQLKSMYFFLQTLLSSHKILLVLLSTPQQSSSPGLNLTTTMPQSRAIGSCIPGVNFWMAVMSV